MIWMLILWELAALSLLMLSLHKLRRELPQPAVKRCEDCRYCADIPDSVVDGFQPGERHCIRGRGIDYSMRNDAQDAYEVVSVVWDNSCCDGWAPKRPGDGCHA